MHTSLCTPELYLEYSFIVSIAGFKTKGFFYKHADHERHSYSLEEIFSPETAADLTNVSAFSLR
jgi:hypothetical protein